MVEKKAIDSFRFRCISVKNLGFSELCVVSYGASSLPSLLSEWLKTYDAILHKLVCKLNCDDFPSVPLSLGNCD